MKRIYLIISLIFSILPLTAKAQDAILEEIAEMDNVEVVYITKSMLQTMSSTNINVGGINLSKIAKDLNSLQILTIKGNAVEKSRNKIKSIRKNNRMETVMTIKDGKERTDVYGIKSYASNYSKLLMSIDETKEITVIYMKGNMGSACFEELTKSTNIYTFNTPKHPSTAKKAKKASSKDISSLNYENGLNLNDYADFNNIDKILGNAYNFNTFGNQSATTQHDDVQVKIDVINKQIDSYNNAIDGLSSSIESMSSSISTATGSTREKLYTARNKLYDARSRIYAKRSELYNKRATLYAEQAKAREKNKNKQNNNNLEYVSFSIMKVSANGKVGDNITVSTTSDNWFLVISTHSTLEKAKKWVKTEYKKDCHILDCGDNRYRIYSEAGTYNRIKAEYNKQKSKNPRITMFCPTPSAKNR